MYLCRIWNLRRLGFAHCLKLDTPIPEIQFYRAREAQSCLHIGFAE